MSDVIVKLTGSGNWEVPANVSTLKDVLIVAGGGGGGRLGGGGGAGGVLHLTDVAVTPEELIAYLVGDGGAGATATSQRGASGGDTTFGSDTATGGGGGGSNGTGVRSGSAGGSGGGGGSASAGAGSGGSGAMGQGSDGGGGTNASPFLCGGGGGAGGVGVDGSTTGNGGTGIDVGSIFGSEFGVGGRLGGGGGGARFTGSPAGVGVDGGGDGGVDSAGTNGTAETGGGGGGGGFNSGNGGSGGSGVILIRYAPAVGNVQAAALGTDSIEVTWDQFTNDDSPPVAADGYEIEIDSGTPIDVGDVQTYTDEDLSPSTQYSYRVRAYYSGSPTEYTEWSETVQATTDSEELTTIPRSFVITADIKLRDEAPEVSEPPAAVNLSLETLADYWDFEEGSGSTITGLHNSTTMTAVNANFQFDSEPKLGDWCGRAAPSEPTRLAPPDSDTLNMAETSFSTATWIRLEQLSGSNGLYIIARNDSGVTQFGIGPIIAGDGRLFFDLTGLTFPVDGLGNLSKVWVDDSDWSLNQWHLLGTSWDRDTGTARIFLDGELKMQRTLSGDGPHNLPNDGAGYETHFMGYSFSFGNSMIGRMDDTMIWLAPSAAKEHSFLWNGGNGRTFSEIFG